MKINKLKEALGISAKDAQFILNVLASDQYCKRARYAGETYRQCTIGEDKHTIWSVL